MLSLYWLQYLNVARQDFELTKRKYNKYIAILFCIKLTHSLLFSIYCLLLLVNSGKTLVFHAFVKKGFLKVDISWQEERKVKTTNNGAFHSHPLGLLLFCITTIPLSWWCYACSNMVCGKTLNSNILQCRDMIVHMIIMVLFKC